MSLESSAEGGIASGTVLDLINSSGECNGWEGFRDDVAEWVTSKHTHQSVDETNESIDRVLKIVPPKASEMVSLQSAFEAFIDQSDDKEKASSTLESALLTVLDHWTFVEVFGAKAAKKSLFKDPSGKPLKMNIKEKQNMLRHAASVLDRHEADRDALNLDLSVLSSARTQLSLHYGPKYNVDFQIKKQTKNKKKRKEQAEVPPSPSKASTKGSKSNIQNPSFLIQLAGHMRQSRAPTAKAPAESVSIQSDGNEAFVPKTLSRSSTSKSLDIGTVITKNGKGILVAKAKESGEVGGWARHRRRESGLNSEPVKDRPNLSKHHKRSEKNPPAKHGKHQTKTSRMFAAEDSDPEVVTTAVEPSATDARSVSDENNQGVKHIIDESVSKAIPEPPTDEQGTITPDDQQTAVQEEQAKLSAKAQEVSESAGVQLGKTDTPEPVTIVMKTPVSDPGDTAQQEQAKPETVDEDNFAEDIRQEAEEAAIESQGVAVRGSRPIDVDGPVEVGSEPLQEVSGNKVDEAPEDAAQTPEASLDAAKEDEPEPAAELEGAS